ncbi:MAG: KUP/HAK/KT family potassium transporter [Candidatus Babeliales bacterium]
MKDFMNNDGLQFQLPRRDLWINTKEIIKSLGVVFGDIGTSPLYTLGSGIFMNFFLTPTVDNIIGVVSLILWTLVILVALEYAWLAMSLGKKGEGGTIVLKEILVPLLKSPTQIAFVTILSFVGISLFFGDGIITPAMSILTSVEGIVLIPGFKNIAVDTLVLMACAITVLLFVFQRRGTERISIAFGPIMLIWFIALGFFGVYGIVQAPSVLKALSPFYAIKFLIHNGMTGFFVLSGVMLCATGGEALYADMGHLGRRPIRRAWYFVFVVLILNYLGQAAFLLLNPTSSMSLSVLFVMVRAHMPLVIYISFLILTLFATVIASQSLISGIFSVVYQGITTNIMPMLKVDYTSNRLRSQVYIGVVNWILMFSVLMIIMLFKQSNTLATAYGFAVSGCMTITGIMMTWIFWRRRNILKLIVSAFVTLVVSVFFMSNCTKLPERGLFSIAVTISPFALIAIYTTGQRKLLRAQQPLAIEEFLEQFEARAKSIMKLKGTALYFVRDMATVPQYVMQTMFKNNIVYEDNILISVVTRDDPFGVIGFFKGNLAPGLRIFEVHMGYMEVLDIEKILRNAGIDPAVIFYGVDEIVTSKIIWKIFAFIKHITPTFVQFYKLPFEKIHGVVTAVEM